MRYLVYCDESSSQGKYYVDFFGGCIVEAGKKHYIEEDLNDCKRQLRLNSEIKWTHVSEPYLDKYCQMMHAFFKYVRNGDIRVRIMFRKKENPLSKSTAVTKEQRYFKLYYQFIKHSFGFRTPKEVTGDYQVSFLLDELPDHSSLANQFRQFIHQMPETRDFENSGLKINVDDIGEVDSRDHVLLQCVDIVLGAMFFRLNRLHEQKDSETGKKGNRTKAKEKLFQVIREEINAIHPSFNIGVSTGNRGYLNPHWESPYEHWLFVQKENT